MNMIPEGKIPLFILSKSAKAFNALDASGLTQHGPISSVGQSPLSYAQANYPRQHVHQSHTSLVVLPAGTSGSPLLSLWGKQDFPIIGAKPIDRLGKLTVVIRAGGFGLGDPENSLSVYLSINMYSKIVLPHFYSTMCQRSQDTLFSSCGFQEKCLHQGLVRGSSGWKQKMKVHQVFSFYQFK